MNFKYLILFLFFFAATGCEKDFEEVNKNPEEPLVTTISPLFNSVISSLQLGWNEQFYLHNEKLYEVTQQAALTARSFQNLNIGTEEMWSEYYTALTIVREIEKRFEAFEGEQEIFNNAKAQLKILVAYKSFRLTDLFGDLPFFDAGKGFQGLENLRPKFDDQESIYKFLLEELAWASDNLNVLPDPVTANETPYFELGNFDTFLNGDMRRWLKFANSLRLKHALRMADKDPDYANPIIAEIISKDLELIEDGEDIVMLPAMQSWKNESVHWSFREHRKLRLGSNVWRWLSDSDDPSGSGIFDPRAHIFFEGNNGNDWVFYPQISTDDTPPSGGSPYQKQRDAAYNFKGQDNIYASFNYYLIRDENTIPQILMTAAEIHFIKAEIFMRGLGVAQSTASAEAEYTTGLVASQNFWQNIFQNSDIWENHPPILSSGQLFGVTNHPKISIFINDNKLELIYAQRWLDAFRQPWDAFALLRRTKMTPYEGPTNNFYRFTYPPSESENNPTNWADQIAKMGRDDTDVKIWWMP